MADGKNYGAVDQHGVVQGNTPQATASQIWAGQGKNSSVNQDAAQKAAHPNSQGPNGSSTWTQNPDGTYTQAQSYGGPLDGANQGLQQQAADQFGQPLPDGSAARDQAIQGAYSQAKSRLDPRFEQQGNQLASQLAAQGLDPNSQAYRTAMQNFGQERNDAYSSAMNGAIGQGTQAGAQIFAQGMQSREAPLQDLRAMQGLLPGAAGSQGLDAWQAANGYTTAQQAQGADAVGGAMKLGGAVSDARMKEDIQPLPWNATDGVPLTTFRYKGDDQPYMGVIAQDLEQANPMAVRDSGWGPPAFGEGGVKTVSPEYAPVAITDEERQAIHGLATAPEQQAELERQYARAQALKKGSGGHHTSMLGAALGGAADVLDRVRGESQERGLDDQSQGLIAGMQRGRSAGGDVAERQRTADYQALVAALKGTGNG